jgi:8-oxo-dGTP diphosphatase
VLQEFYIIQRGKEMKELKTPYLAVDAVIRTVDNKIVLIERKFEPLGLALPGGFVDYGESCEDAVRREVFEETGLNFYIERLIGVYSNPKRDPRQHVVSIVYSGTPWGYGVLIAGDDAKKVKLLGVDQVLNNNLAFDHRQILTDYIMTIQNGFL